MSRFHKVQQRTNVFTMLVLVVGLYIAFRYTSFKKTMKQTIEAGKGPIALTWQAGESPFVGWINLGAPLVDSLSVSLQPEPLGCRPSTWDLAKKRAFGEAPVRVIFTLEPLQTGKPSHGYSRTLSPSDMEQGTEIAARIPADRHLAMMICTDEANSNSCLGKSPAGNEALATPQRDELYYFQYLIREPDGSRIGVVDLQKQAKSGFAALRSHLIQNSTATSPAADAIINTLTVAHLAAAYPAPFVAGGKLIQSLPIFDRTDCPPIKTP